MHDTLDNANRDISKRILIARLIGRMRKHGSWSGATHVQKSVFFLNQLLKVDVPFNFVLHYHGPFSRDLHEVLNWLEQYGEVGVEARGEYGPRYYLTYEGMELAEKQGDNTDRIEWVSELIAPKSVTELEPVSTALFLKMQRPERSDSDTAAEINRLKPHISVPAAVHAIRELDELRSRAREDGLIASAS